MLGQQYFTNEKYIPSLKEHFVVLTIDLDQSPGSQLADQYRMRWFPSTLILKPDGTVYDILRGYEGNADRYHARVQAALTGGASYAEIRGAAAARPDDLQRQFDLAWKYLDMIYLDEAEARLHALSTLVDTAGDATVTLDERAFPLPEAVSYARGVLTYRGGRNPEGLLAFIAAFPQSALRNRADTDLANAFTRRMRHQQAESFFRELINRYPDDTQMHFSTVRYAVGTGKLLDQAEPLLLGLLSSHAEREDVKKMGADFFIKKDNLPRALDCFGPAVAEKQWDNAAALNSYAWFWAERGLNLDSAERAAKRSLELASLHHVWDTLSMVYWKKKAFQKAIDAEEQAVKLSDQPAYREQIKKIRADMSR